MNHQIEQAKSIFLNALDRRPDDVSDYLNEACGNDSSLRHRVEVLLKGHRNAAGLAQRAIAACEDALSTDFHDSDELNLVGKQVGPYRVREKIGEGGMGIVYVAEQSEPMRRKVALKVIKPGMNSREVLARFESERQALAVMEHPNIAQILDAGISDSGQPYFAMELIRGISFTEYCDENSWSLQGRLGLFVDVCHAVQHAHQKGILHRDIKPSNVLVTQIDGNATVKVIDFGLAKATGGQQLTDKSVYTHFMKFMGTPAYMSPEQAGLGGIDIDTRSDIYSLGVLLYVILTGDAPISENEISEASLEEIYRQIRHDDVPKPSYRVHTLENAARTTIATQRRMAPDKLALDLRGDLDWIVLKALDKDRDRRYETAAAFAADIRRYLAGEPVSAAAPSPWYTFTKFAKRHRTALATAASFLALLVTATCVSSVLAVRADEQATIANAAKVELETVIVDKDDALQLAKDSEALATKLRQSVEKERDRLVALNYANTVIRARHELESGYPYEAQRLLGQVADDPNRGFEWYHLQHRLHPETVEIKMETELWFDVPKQMAYSPDGNRVAICERRRQRIRIFDVSTQFPEELNAFNCGNVPLSVAYSHTGQHMAVVTHLTGQPGMFEVAIYDSHCKRLHSLPHRYLSNFKSHLDKWSVGSGYAIAFCPISNRLATLDFVVGTNDLRVRIWDVDSGQATQELLIRDVDSTQHWVQFSADGKRITITAKPVHGAKSRWTKVFDLASEEQIAAVEGSCVFSADSERLILRDDKRSWVMDVNRPDQANEFVKWEGGMHEMITSPDGQWVAGSTPNGTYLWRADTRELVATLPIGPVHLAFSPTGKSLATLGNSLKIWDLSTPPFAEKMVSDESLQGASYDIAWAPDNIRVLFSARPGAVEIWNTRTGETEVFRDEKGEQHQSTSVSWSGDGSMIAIAIEDLTNEKTTPKGLGIFDARTHQRIKTLADDLGTCYAVRFSPDSKWLAARFEGGVLLLWDTLNWNMKTFVDAGQLTDGGYLASCFSFAPDSRELAVCRVQPRIDFIDVKTGGLLRSHSVEPGSPISANTGWNTVMAKQVYGIDHSPDGALVVVQVARRVDVLDCRSGGVQFQTAVTHSRHGLVSFTPGGRLMMTGSDGTYNPQRTRIFEISHGTELIRFEQADAPTFSPDGRQLFIISQLSNSQQNHPNAPERDDWRLRGGIIYRAMSPDQFQRHANILNSSPPNDKPSFISDPDDH
jgi:serine/threonine protein kinase/WD40 repeat protein